MSENINEELNNFGLDLNDDEIRNVVLILEDRAQNMDTVKRVAKTLPGLKSLIEYKTGKKIKNIFTTNKFDVAKNICLSIAENDKFEADVCSIIENIDSQSLLNAKDFVNGKFVSGISPKCSKVSKDVIATMTPPLLRFDTHRNWSRYGCGNPNIKVLGRTDPRNGNRHVAWAIDNNTKKDILKKMIATENPDEQKTVLAKSLGLNIQNIKDDDVFHITKLKITSLPKYKKQSRILPPNNETPGAYPGWWVPGGKTSGGSKECIIVNWKTDKTDTESISLIFGDNQGIEKEINE